MEELYSTGEFAKLCGCSKDTLFLYDEIGLLKPTIIKKNGYRYYSIRQLFLFNRITSLCQSGLSLHNIKDIFDNENINEYLETLTESLAHLREKEAHLKQSIETLEYTLKFLKSFKKLSTDSANPELFNMELEFRKEGKLSAVSESFRWRDSSVFIRQMNNALATMREEHIGSESNLGFFIREESFQDGSFDEMAFCCFGDRYNCDTITRPEGVYLSMMFVGDFTQIPSAFEKLYSYVDSMGFIVQSALFGEMQFVHRNKAERMAIPLDASKLEGVSSEERSVLEQDERFEKTLIVILKLSVCVTLGKQLD